MPPYPDERTKRTLFDWFSRHSSDPTIEIEARIRNVTALGFEAVLRHLKSNTDWSNTPVERDTLDRVHASGVRETLDYATTSRSFMRKTRMHYVEALAAPEHPVRFAVASETACGPDESPVCTYRFKKRITFVRKGMFSFELTRVRDGPTEQAARSSPSSHEIELEFCGQKLRPMPNAQYLTDSMLMKVKDVVNRLLQAASQPPPPAKRARLSDGFREAQKVQVLPGVSVKLERAGHDVPAPFEGELPAEIAGTIPWLLSHVEKSEPDGEPMAHIMNLPCAIATRHYPLFFLYGIVPTASLKTLS